MPRNYLATKTRSGYIFPSCGTTCKNVTNDSNRCIHGRLHRQVINLNRAQRLLRRNQMKAQAEAKQRRQQRRRERAIQAQRDVTNTAAMAGPSIPPITAPRPRVVIPAPEQQQAIAAMAASSNDIVPTSQLPQPTMAGPSIPPITAPRPRVVIPASEQNQAIAMYTLSNDTVRTTQQAPQPTPSSQQTLVDDTTIIPSSPTGTHNQSTSPTTPAQSAGQRTTQSITQPITQPDTQAPIPTQPPTTTSTSSQQTQTTTTSDDPALTTYLHTARSGRVSYTARGGSFAFTAASQRSLDNFLADVQDVREREFFTGVTRLLFGGDLGIGNGDGDGGERDGESRVEDSGIGGM